MKLTDYKRKKGQLPEKDYGKIYVFTSNRKGVTEITEHLIWEVERTGTRTHPLPVTPVYRYTIKESPHHIEMIGDEKVSSRAYFFSGIGDCWDSTVFASMDRDLLEIRREEEERRVDERYLSKNDNEWAIIYAEYIKNPLNPLNSGDFFRWLRKKYVAPKKKKYHLEIKK